MADHSKDPFEGLIDLRDLVKKPWGHKWNFYRNLIHKGELQGFKHGRHVFVRLEDVKPKPIPVPKRVECSTGNARPSAALSRATPATKRASKREAVTKPASKKKGKRQI